MKKWLTLVLMLALFATPGMASAASSNAPIKVFVDGKQLVFDVEPIMTNNTTLVQYTTVFKALGMKYTWNQQQKMITGYNDYVLMYVAIDNKTAWINGREVKMAVPAKVRNGRTLVPLRFISEATGAKVVWDGKQRTVTITSAPEKTELSQWMREHRWDDSLDAVLASEKGELLEKNAFTLAYNAVALAGYSSYPIFHFSENKLYSIDYMVDMKDRTNDEALVAIGTLYNHLEAHFGLPYRDELYFYDAADYHEEVERFAESIAAGEAELTATWQLGYTEIELAAFSDEAGGIDLYVTLFNTK